MVGLPVGKIYSRNIIPDIETGIGGFTDAGIARTLRYGGHPDGTAVFDFMPFHNTSDEDLTAIISYLRSLPAVSNSVPRHDLNLLGMPWSAFGRMTDDELTAIYHYLKTVKPAKR